MRVIIACAGTGGHINPGIAIAKIIEKNERSDIMFIGTESGLENELVKKAGYEIKHIRTGKLYRKITLKNFKSIFNNIVGIKDAQIIIKDFKPDIIIGTGGYICGAVMIAAKRMKVPYVLHESNAFPGKAVKLLSRNAAKVLLGFDEAKVRFKNQTNLVYTGTPAKFTALDIDNLNLLECRKKVGIADNNIDKKIIFVFGGSQGAKYLNNTVIDMVLKEKDDNMFVIMATGKNNYDSVIKRINKEVDIDKYIKAIDFVYDMEEMYKAADVLITRAGAMTITEISLAGKPSILIPFPYAAENHQLYNARILEKIGAAKVIEEKDLNESILYSNICDITKSNETLDKMGSLARSESKENVEVAIFKEIKELVK